MSKTVESVALLSSSPGARHQLKVHRYGTPGARPKAYIQAALHADEYPALLVAHHLIEQLDKLESRSEIIGEVVVVPVANPIGLGQRVNDRHLGRYDLAGGGNYNRNWPDLSARVLERIEADLTDDPEHNVSIIRRALQVEVSNLPVRKELDHLRKALLSYSIDADVVLDLHSDSQALFHLYASVHHEDLARELGRDLQARAVLLETEAGGSPFDECNAGVWWRLKQSIGSRFPIPLACFSSTVEHRGEQDVEDGLASHDAEGILRFLQRRGAIKGDAGPLPEKLCEPTPLEGTDLIYAPAAGLIVYQKELGDWVVEGEVVAELVRLLPVSNEPARTPLVSKTSGLFFAHMGDRMVGPGAALAKICGSVPLAHRESGKLLEA